MRQPDIYMADAIKNWDTLREVRKGLWVPARPIGHNAWSWKMRWNLAWKVLMGKCDVLNWEPKNTEKGGGVNE